MTLHVAGNDDIYGICGCGEILSNRSNVFFYLIFQTGNNVTLLLKGVKLLSGKNSGWLTKHQTQK